MSLRNLLVGLAIWLIVGLAVVGVGRVFAQNSFTLKEWTTDSGGGTLSGASFTLSGTLGQPDAGVFTGGSFRLYGGFWGVDETTEPQSETPHSIFLPAINTE